MVGWHVTDFSFQTFVVVLCFGNNCPDVVKTQSPKQEGQVGLSYVLVSSPRMEGASGRQDSCLLSRIGLRV